MSADLNLQLERFAQLSRLCCETITIAVQCRDAHKQRDTDDHHDRLRELLDIMANDFDEFESLVFKFDGALIVADGIAAHFVESQAVAGGRSIIAATGHQAAQSLLLNMIESAAARRPLRLDDDECWRLISRVERERALLIEHLVPSIADDVFSPFLKTAVWRELLAEGGVPISQRTFSRRCSGTFVIHHRSTSKMVSIRLDTLPPDVAARFARGKNGRQIDGK